MHKPLAAHRASLPQAQKRACSYIICGEQGWHSGESTCLPNVDRVRILDPAYMWVEFVVLVLILTPIIFCQGVTPVFLPPQKPTFLNSNLIWKHWNSHLFIYYLFIITSPRPSRTRTRSNIPTLWRAAAGVNMVITDVKSTPKPNKYFPPNRDASHPAGNCVMM